MIVGLILVFAFMIIYYRVGGLVADISLIFNLLLVLGALAGLRATLTFPGIAGLILTVGMAVDANILIFERMREELRLGKTPRAVVEAGFSRAMLTIVDANLTTLVAALVLFQFGTGPIRGFAITLSLGILSTLFTALVLGRLVFDYLYSRGIARKLYI
jgi:preprotein translocase subunit SecD